MANIENSELPRAILQLTSPYPTYASCITHPLEPRIYMPHVSCPLSSSPTFFSIFFSYFLKLKQYKYFFFFFSPPLKFSDAYKIPPPMFISPNPKHNPKLT